MNSTGETSVTNSRSNAPRSRSPVIELTANVLTSTRLNTNNGAKVMAIRRASSAASRLSRRAGLQLEGGRVQNHRRHNAENQE